MDAGFMDILDVEEEVEGQTEGCWALVANECVCVHVEGVMTEELGLMFEALVAVGADVVVADSGYRSGEHGHAVVEDVLGEEGERGNSLLIFH